MVSVMEKVETIMKLKDFEWLIKDSVSTFRENMEELQSKGECKMEVSKEEWMRTFLSWLEYETDMHAVYWAER